MAHARSGAILALRQDQGELVVEQDVVGREGGERATCEPDDERGCCGEASGAVYGMES